MMVWPIGLNYNLKTIEDINYSSIYGHSEYSWSEMLIREGYNPPVADNKEVIQGWWWQWGN